MDTRITFLRSHQSKRSLVVLGVVGVFLVCSAYFVFRPNNMSHSSYFTVVLDCGSTGSRVDVYEWLINNTQDHPVLARSLSDHSSNSSGQKGACLYHCLQTEPGLDKFVNNSSGVRDAVKPLLLWAEKQIPSERHQDTSLFILATAGLRRLPSEDARWILENVEAVARLHPFMYRRNWIRVLSGQEEAYYGWVALNHKMGSLGSSSMTPTLGVLDLGGSSLQVVMETDKSRDHLHFVKSNIGSVEHNILAYSLPAFGLNEAFDRTIIMLWEEQLAENNDGSFQLRHPCLSSGFSQNYTCYGCFQPNVTNLPVLSGQLQNNQSNLFYIVGDPDWEQCMGLARAVATHSSSSDWSQLITDMNCKANLSSSDGTNLRNWPTGTTAGRHVSSFHALSGFFAVYNVLNLNPKANITKLLESGQQLCARSWPDLKRYFGNRKYAEQFCFRVPYMASLIKDALCVGDAELVFGPGDVSWTLGAALVEGEPIWLSNLEARAGSSTLENVEALFSPTFIFLLLLSILFIIYWGQVRRSTIFSTYIRWKKATVVGPSLPSYIHARRASI